MNKKRLPKAIQQLPVRIQDTDAATAPDLPPEPGPTQASAMAAQAHASVMTETTDPAAPEPDTAAVVEATRPAPISPLRPLTSRASGSPNRRRQAEVVIERHANYSAVGGMIPLPLINAGAVTSIIVRMVRMLSRVYGIPFHRYRARALVLGLIGGLSPAAAASLTATTLVYFLPGSNLVGLAVSSLTASQCTRRIGLIFVEHFETGASLIDFPLPRPAKPR